MKALILVPIGHESSDLCPSFRKFFIELEELIVLFGGPGFDFAFGDLLVFLFDFHTYLFAIFLHENGELSLHSSILII